MNIKDRVDAIRKERLDRGEFDRIVTHKMLDAAEEVSLLIETLSPEVRLETAQSMSWVMEVLEPDHNEGEDAPAARCVVAIYFDPKLLNKE